MGRGDNILPDYRPKRNRANDYLIDRQLQKTDSFTGIYGVNTQDFALQEGMGAILDRTQEHVGTTDRAIILLRKILLESLTAMEERPPSCGPTDLGEVAPRSAGGGSHDPQGVAVEERL